MFLSRRSLSFFEFLADCFFSSSQKTKLLLLTFFLSFPFSTSSTYYPVKVSWDDHNLFDIVKGKDTTMKPSFIAIVLYPFFFVGFSGLPIWKGRYMQLFQRINVNFPMGMGWVGGGGWGIFNLLHDLLYELINSINIHLLCFIYLFLLLL